MNDAIPTPQEAQTAIAEGANQAGRVRRSENQFRLILLALAAIYLAAGILVGFFRGSRFAGIVLLVILVGGLVGVLTLRWRIRAYSRSGIRWFSLSCAAFSIWNGAVVGVSFATGWWGYHQPGIHFTVSVVLAEIPLLVAAWLVGRRRE